MLTRRGKERQREREKVVRRKEKSTTGKLEKREKERNSEGRRKEKNITCKLQKERE